MYIELHFKEGLVSMRPDDSKDYQIFDALQTLGEPGKALNYLGRESHPTTGRTVYLNFNVGGTPEKETDGVVTRTVYKGGADIALWASDDGDQDALDHIRNAVYFGENGLIYIGPYGEGRNRVLHFTLANCKHCGTNAVEMAAAQKSVCKACSEKCEHTYGPGIFAKSCGKCAWPREEKGN